MTSTSVSDYQRWCAEYIKEAVRRPQMYFQSLEELEATMGGHAVAFSQIGAIGRDDAFNTRFANWLYESKRASGASGWAHAVTTLIASEGDDVNALFSGLVEEFLQAWSTSAIQDSEDR